MRKNRLIELINDHVKSLSLNETEDTRITLLRDYVENVLDDDIKYDDFDYYLHSEFQIDLEDFEDENTRIFFEKFRSLS